MIPVEAVPAKAESRNRLIDIWNQSARKLQVRVQPQKGTTRDTRENFSVIKRPFTTSSTISKPSVKTLISRKRIKVLDLPENNPESRLPYRPCQPRNPQRCHLSFKIPSRYLL